MHIENALYKYKFIIIKKKTSYDRGLQHSRNTTIHRLWYCYVKSDLRMQAVSKLNLYVKSIDILISENILGWVLITTETGKLIEVNCFILFLEKVD